MKSSTERRDPVRSARDTLAVIALALTALGLTLIFSYFQGLGGMALVVAWWGIWHLLVGTSLATWWRRHPPVPDTLRAAA